MYGGLELQIHAFFTHKTAVDHGWFSFLDHLMTYSEVTVVCNSEVCQNRNSFVDISFLKNQIWDILKLYLSDKFM